MKQEKLINFHKEIIDLWKVREIAIGYGEHSIQGLALFTVLINVAVIGGGGLVYCLQYYQC